MGRIQLDSHPDEFIATPIFRDPCRCDNAPVGSLRPDFFTQLYEALQSFYLWLHPPVFN